MAILANRRRITVPSTEILRFLFSCFKKFIAFVLIAISLQLLYSTTPQKKISGIILEMQGSMMYVVFSVCDIVIERINELAQTLNYFKDLESKNAELELEITRLRSMQSMNNSIQYENAEFRKLLPIVQEQNFNCIIARLLSISINAFSQTGVIAAGKNQGVDVDQIVTSAEGLIGKITEVSDNYSKVMLINDFNSRIPVITSISHERGILVGGKELNMLYLRSDHSINIGESLITSGDGIVYPYGLEVAKVERLKNGNIVARSIIDWSNIGFVVIQKLP